MNQEARRAGVEANLLCDLGAENSGGSTSDIEPDVEFAEKPNGSEALSEDNTLSPSLTQAGEAFLAFRQRHVLNEKL